MSLSPLIRVLPHLAAVLVVLMCGRLAIWQFDRAAEKRDVLQAWEGANAVSLDQAVSDGTLYGRVRAQGRFDTERHVLLDNQVRAGQAGVHVLTPFRPLDGRTAWLVNRGWHALPSRQRPLPRIDTPAGTVTIEGRVSHPPRVGRQLGEARALDPGDWPNLVTYLDIARVEDALELDLADRVILLDPAHDTHLTGDEWRPVSFGPDRHRAYAWQWITMGIVVFLIWVALTWRSLRRPS
jgi:cytochrome oxidase assembly protein ShyY1